MSVYVDRAFIRARVRNGARFVASRWCHMTADTPEELHAFAARLGLRRAWFQEHPTLWHYDVTESKRRWAVQMGAIEVTSCELVAIEARRRRGLAVLPPAEALAWFRGEYGPVGEHHDCPICGDLDDRCVHAAQRIRCGADPLWSA